MDAQSIGIAAFAIILFVGVIVLFLGPLVLGWQRARTLRASRPDAVVFAARVGPSFFRFLKTTTRDGSHYTVTLVFSSSGLDILAGASRSAIVSIGWKHLGKPRVLPGVSRKVGPVILLPVLSYVQPIELSLTSGWLGLGEAREAELARAVQEIERVRTRSEE